MTASEKMEDNYREMMVLICRLCKRLNPQHKECTSCEDMEIYRQALTAYESAEKPDLKQRTIAEWRDKCMLLQAEIEQLKTPAREHAEEMKSLLLGIRAACMGMPEDIDKDSLNGLINDCLSWLEPILITIEKEEENI